MSLAPTLVSAAPSALACLALLCLAPQPGDKDYTNVPLDPHNMQMQLTATKYSLAQATEMACKETGGYARSAEMTFDRGKSLAQVMTYADGKAWSCTVNAHSGEMTKSEIPPFTWPGDPVTGDWITTPSGLRYTDLKVGDGDQPKGPSSEVKIHYSGWLLDGTKFDSSVDRGQPFTKALREFMPGWIEGVGSMHVGGKRKLCIPYRLAFGENGLPPQIPPRATLVFDIELLDITKP